jgi:pyruvate kinase
MIIITTNNSTISEVNTRKIILAGTDYIRINLFRRSVEKNIDLILETNKEILEMNSGTKLLLDMPLNKVALGDFEDKIFQVQEGNEYILRSADYSQNCAEYIPVQIQNIAQYLRADQILMIGDGEISIQVTEILDEQNVKIRALNNGSIFYKRSINIKKEESIYENLKKYIEVLNHAHKKHVDIKYISFPYINNDINENIKNFLNSNLAYKKIKKIIKLENEQCIKDIDKIISDDFYDAVLFNRGLIGVNLPFENNCILEKKIVKKAKENKKKIFVGSNILESTVDNFLPSRAEISDLTNLVLDGVDGIQFSTETSVFTRPAYTIATAKKIIAAAKKYKV